MFAVLSFNLYMRGKTFHKPLECMELKFRFPGELSHCIIATVSYNVIPRFCQQMYQSFAVHHNSQSQIRP